MEGKVGKKLSPDQKIHSSEKVQLKKLVSDKLQMQESFVDEDLFDFGGALQPKVTVQSSEDVNKMNQSINQQRYRAGTIS